MTSDTELLLYPRLPSSVGRDILAKRAGSLPTELEDLASLTHPAAAPAATGGHPVTEARLQTLQTAIRAIASEAGYPKPLKRGSEQAFDRPCGNQLFNLMGIVPADAAEEGVWTFVSLVLVPEVGPWRFPDMADERLLGRPRNVFRRLWWRAWSLGPSLDEAPDGCSPLGEDEFVQILERPSLGGNQRTARALRDGLWRMEAAGIAVARSELMRQMARRLRAVRSHIALDALTDTQLSDLVDDVARDSLKSLV